MLKTLIPTLIFSTFLPAQQRSVEPVKMFEFGFGLKTAMATGFALSPLTGETPSVGAVIYSRYSFKYPKIAIRLKGVFDNWGNQHLKGTIDKRSEVKRLTGNLGLMMYGSTRDGRNGGGYFCLESGIAHWDIKSTYEPLANIKTNKYAAAFLMGGESRHVYLEFGIEFAFIGRNTVVAEEDYVHQNKDEIIRRRNLAFLGGIGGGLVLGFGCKF